MKKLLLLLFTVPFLGFGQTKISDMPAATTPTGTELVPIVQGGANKKATINQINSGYIKTADFYTIGDGRWLKLPALPGVGQDGQALRWNNGSLVWEYYTPGGFTLTNGNGTTVNGTGDGVDAGGVMTNNIVFNGGGIYNVAFGTGGPANIGRFDVYATDNIYMRSYNTSNFPIEIYGGDVPLLFNNGTGNKWIETNILKIGVDLRIDNPTNNFRYIINGAAIVADRTVTLPLLTGNDTFVTANFNQALTNKSVNGVTLVNGGTSTKYLSEDGTYTTPSGGGSGLTVGTSTITSGTNTRILYNNSGVLGEYTVSGSGNVAMTTSPTFTTPALGTPSALVGTNITGTATGLTSGITNALKSATTTVDVSAATAPTSGQVLTATSGTAATWQTPSGGGGAWSLASGGTATGTNTFAMGSNPFILTSGVTTGTGATAGFQRVYNSLTSGNGDDLSSSSYTNGAIQKITSTSTAINNTISTNGVSQIAVSGAMASSRIAIGQNISVTTTGTTSKNVGLVLNTSGATDNIALLVPTGNIGVGGNFTPSSIFHIQTSGTSVTNRVESTNSNSAVTFSAKAGGGVELLFGQYGTTKSAYGAIGSGYGYLYTGGNLAFAVDNASGAIKFGIGSSVPEVAKITTTGMILGSSSVTGNRTIKATNSATTADLILDSDNYIKMNKYVLLNDVNMEFASSTGNNRINVSGSTGLQIFDNNLGVAINNSNGSFDLIDNISTLTGNTTLVAQGVVLVDATSGNITITLPAAASNVKREYTIQKIDSSINTVTVDANASEVINGALTQVLATQYAFIKIKTNGTEWYIIAK